MVLIYSLSYTRDQVETISLQIHRMDILEYVHRLGKESQDQLSYLQGFHINDYRDCSMKNV